VVVRSSAADEDTSRASFAGLHQSYVNIQGVESILDHMRLVWASLKRLSERDLTRLG
jgi:phosphoenolpyruvate synthase/pyruvate phosphate dikinase